MVKTFSGKGFAAGAMFVAALIGMVQDMYGKEEYIRIIQSHWIELHWAFWIMPLGISIGALMASMSVELSKKNHKK